MQVDIDILHDFLFQGLCIMVKELPEGEKD